MREAWREMSLLQRVLLAILAAMILGFGIATPIMGTREGIEYGNTLLHSTQEGEVRRYTGRIDGRRAEFAVTPDGTVEYRWGDEAYGPYRVAEDPSASPKGSMAAWNLPGIEIRRGDEVLFRGGLYDGERPILYDEDGEPFNFLSITYGTSGGKVYDSNGKELTQRDLHEPGLSIVARLAHRGSFAFYLLGTLLAAFNMFQICFPGLMFRQSIRWHVKDPYAAEPSDFYIFMEQVEWVILTVVAAALYWLAITAVN